MVQKLAILSTQTVPNPAGIGRVSYHHLVFQFQIMRRRPNAKSILLIITAAFEALHARDILGYINPSCLIGLCR